MEARLQELLSACDHDAAVRAIVITGAGKAFCAGVDIQAARMERQPGPVEVHNAEARDGETLFDQRYGYLLGIQKPIVCALNGAAVGVGLVLALYCDIRYASERARLGAIFARRGLPAEHGVAWLLPRLIGLSRSAEWLFTGRMMEASEAARIGLVSDVLPAAGFLDGVLERVRTITEACSPRAVRVIKQQLYPAATQTLAYATGIAEHEVSAARTTDDFKEGFLHFLEKRKPSFTGT